jgi:hypothetical protein
LIVRQERIPVGQVGLAAGVTQQTGFVGQVQLILEEQADGPSGQERAFQRHFQPGALQGVTAHFAPFAPGKRGELEGSVHAVGFDVKNQL